jgi:glutamate-1-semialdehyde 2,1-aminomutase
MLIEPIMGNCLGIAAEPEYLRAARALCDKYGVVLLIDEVKTGFRVARGGVQELYGVMRICAPSPRRSAMAIRFRCSRAASTSCARSARASRTAAPTRRTRYRSRRRKRRSRSSTRPTRSSALPTYGTRLRLGMRAVLSARGIAHSFVGHPSMSGLYFAHEPPRNYRAWKSSDYSFYDAMAQVLHDEGVLCEPDSREPWFISARTTPRASPIR